MKKKNYEEALAPLRVELNNLAHWLQHTGQRMLVIFEGCDAAGKGGCINAIAETLSPRPASWCCSTAAGTTAPASRR